MSVKQETADENMHWSISMSKKYSANRKDYFNNACQNSWELFVLSPVRTGALSEFSSISKPKCFLLLVLVESQARRVGFATMQGGD